MTRPTRHEQARAILQRRARRMASSILGRQASSSADFAEAFTLERIDLIAEIPTPGALVSLGRNRPGPRDGLYIMEDADGFRVYVQERGIPFDEESGLSFDEAREGVIDRVIRLQGVPLQL